MKHLTKRYLFTFILLNTYFNTISQISLKIKPYSKNDSIVLSKVNYQKKHQTIKSVNNEILLTIKKIQKLGYFTNSIEKTNETPHTHSFLLKTDKKINTITIYDPSSEKEYLVKIKDLENFMKGYLKKLNTTGKVFSEIKLKNITYLNNNLTATISIVKSPTRHIDKVIVKGYENFPKNYIKNYLKISTKTIFNKNKLEEISEAIGFLDFTEETSKPQTLFSKDSTIVYLYLKKKKENIFDGLINFSKKKDFEINGQLNLNLKNIFNKGESFSLNWNKTNKNDQILNIQTTINYIFNSPFSPEISLNIFKKDSSYLNTKFKSIIKYNITPKTTIGISYQSEKSALTSNIKSGELQNFKNYFLGLDYRYKIKLKEFDKNKFELLINPMIGNRQTLNKKTNQLKLNFNTAYTFKIDYKNYLFIKNSTGYINSKNILTNEKFRIGGNNSIRGFQEQSILTKKYFFFNLEYHYLITKKTKLYFITDFGKSEINKLSALGGGFSFFVKKNRINIGYFLGSTNLFKNNDSFLGIKLINKF